MARRTGVEGEGSYSGTRNYNQRTKKFIESGKVKQAARRARPESAKQAAEMAQAERAGRRRAKR